MNFVISNVLIYALIELLINDPFFIEKFCSQLKKEHCNMVYNFYMELNNFINNSKSINDGIDNIITNEEWMNKYALFFEKDSIEKRREKINYLIEKMQTFINENESGPLYASMLEKLIADKYSLLQNIKYHPDSDKIAVIIDPRYDILMESVIINFMHFMNPKGWNLLIVSHMKYKDEIMQKIPSCIFYAIDESQITYDSNNVPNITLDTYNNILLNKDFWNKIPASTITIFQKDCIMYKMFDDIYTEYDYCGANFYESNQSYYCGGINGGFSIRKKSAMIECIDKVTWELITRYNAILHNFSNENICNNKKKSDISILNEDVFFTCACEILRKNIPDIIHRKKLAIEIEHNIETSVYHGWNKNFHTKKKATELLQNSPLFVNYVK